MIHEHVGIYLGGVGFHSGLHTFYVYGSIVEETEKAVKFRAEGTDKVIWFPKSALKETTEPGELHRFYELKKWFQPNGYQGWYMNTFQTHRVNGQIVNDD